MNYYTQLLVNGVVAGGVYALAALGFGITFGALRVVNFAFGATCVVGGYTGYLCVVALGWPGWLAGVGAAGAGAVTGLVVERVAFRPFRDRPALLAMVASLACAIVIENAIAAAFGNDVRSYRRQVVSPLTYQFMGSSISRTQVVILVACACLLALIYAYIRKTRLGWETVAVSDDADAAATWGIDRAWIVQANFAIGSALGGVAGFLIGLDLDVEPYMGTEIVFRAYTANLMLGLGSLPGAVVGGLGLGIVENGAAGLLSSAYKSAFTFIVLVTILVARPRGVLNVRTRRFET